MKLFSPVAFSNQNIQDNKSMHRYHKANKNVKFQRKHSSRLLFLVISLSYKTTITDK